MFLTTKYGLGYVPRFLPFQQYKISAYTQMVRLSSVFWDFGRPNGYEQIGVNFNSPFVSTVIDQAGTD